jgi:hypothetical protein
VAAAVVDSNPSAGFFASRSTAENACTSAKSTSLPRRWRTRRDVGTNPVTNRTDGGTVGKVYPKKLNEKAVKLYRFVEQTTQGSLAGNNHASNAEVWRPAVPSEQICNTASEQVTHYRGISCARSAGRSSVASTTYLSLEVPDGPVCRTACPYV